MKFEIFSLDYLRFIFTNVWTFFGFLLLILVIKGNVGKVISFIGLSFSKIADVYRKIIMRQSIEQRTARKPDILKKDGL